MKKLVIPGELGEVEVRLLDWLKSEGDAIAVGDALLEFETDKAIVVVTAAENGIVRRALAGAGDWMKPGDVVAWIAATPDEMATPEGGSSDAALQVTFDVT